MRGTPAKFALLVSLLFLWSQAAALSAGPYEEGLKHFNAGRYRHAVQYLSEAAIRQPASVMVHYYLANALVHVGLHPQAVSEYALAYRLDPTSTVATYCRQALQAYGQPASEYSGRNAAYRGAGGAVPSAESVINDLGGSGEAEEVHRAKSVIRRQAASEKEKHRCTGEMLATGALGQAELEARRIQEDAKAEIQRILEPPPMIVGRGRLAVNPYYFDPNLARLKAEQVQRNADEAANSARRAAEVRANQFRAWSKEREYSLDEVVANLESQLEEPPGRSSVHLQPVGTDLYVRFYGYGRAAKELPEARPAVLRIVDRDSVPESANGLAGQAKHLNPQKLRYIKVVHGRILH